MINFSKVILYLDLFKKSNRNPTLNDLDVMLYFLKDYCEVKAFWNKLKDHKFQQRIKFITGNLIYFIEDYDDCEEIANFILNRAQRKYYTLFTQ